MKSWVAAAVAFTLTVVLVGASFFFFYGGTSNSSSSSSTGYTASATSTAVSSNNGLELRLALNASTLPSSGKLGVVVSEYNTQPKVNNVTKADLWRVQGMSLGSCEHAGSSVYPFGIAVFEGRYSQANVSRGTPMQIFPPVPCPMFIRLVTGYLFQPMNASAIVLPSSNSSTPLPMSVMITVSGEYVGLSSSSSSSLPKPLSPGVYTIAAGDEWGALETLQFTVTGQASVSTTNTTTSQGQTGTLAAEIRIGPITPVCSSNTTTRPALPPYSTVIAVVTSSSSGTNVTSPVNWVSNGCDVSGSFELILDPGTYTLGLSSCPWMGCGAALPKSFVISPGQTTSVSVSIDTGIR